jgi:hypothetical protein
MRAASLRAMTEESSGVRADWNSPSAKNISSSMRRGRAFSSPS